MRSPKPRRRGTRRTRRPRKEASEPNPKKMAKKYTKTSDFHQLSPELRQMVFKLVLSRPVARNDFPALIIALRPENELYYEALELFYHVAQFYLTQPEPVNPRNNGWDVTLRPQFHSFGSDHRKIVDKWVPVIRHLTIGYPVEDWNGSLRYSHPVAARFLVSASSLVSPVLQGLVDLREITIGFDIDHYACENDAEKKSRPFWRQLLLLIPQWLKGFKRLKRLNVTLPSDLILRPELNATALTRDMPAGIDAMNILLGAKGRLARVVADCTWQQSHPHARSQSSPEQRPSQFERWEWHAGKNQTLDFGRLSETEYEVLEKSLRTKLAKYQLALGLNG